MQINDNKIIYIAIISIFFTIIFIPLLRYFVISYFKELKNDIEELKGTLKLINITTTNHFEKVTERMIAIDDRCSDRNSRIGKIEGRLNGK